jgi:hypothetical protein
MTSPVDATQTEPAPVVPSETGGTVTETEAQLAPVAAAAPAVPDPAPPPATAGRGFSNSSSSSPARETSTPERAAAAKPPRQAALPPAKPADGRVTSNAAAGAPAKPEPAPVATTAAGTPVTEPAGAPATSQTYEPPSAPVPIPEAPAIPERQFDELVVPADAVIGLQIENAVTTDTARVEDRVSARVTRDVRTGGLVAIPAGAKVQGSVVLVERGGKFKERARLGVRFHTIVLASGETVPIQSETVFREGDSPKGQSAAKISGGAIGGAIIGAILGGGKGAIIGGATGAGAGTAAVAAGDRSEAKLSAGSSVTVRLASPASVTVERVERVDR